MCVHVTLPIAACVWGGMEQGWIRLREAHYEPAE